MTNQDKMRADFYAWARKWSHGVLNSDDDAGLVSWLGAWAAWQAATAAARTGTNATPYDPSDVAFDASKKPESIDTSPEGMELDALKSSAAIAWGWLWHVTTEDDRVTTARQYCNEMGIPQKNIIDNGRYTAPKGKRWMV